jgi:hypothetical protein
MADKQNPRAHFQDFIAGAYRKPENGLSEKQESSQSGSLSFGLINTLSIIAEGGRLTTDTGLD